VPGEPRSEFEERSLREIGRIAAAFGLLELLVNVILRSVVGLDARTAAALFTGDDVGRQLERLRNVTREWPDLQAWVNEVTNLKTIRNDILHAGWFGTADEPEVGLTFRFKRGSVAMLEARYTVSDLEAIADRMEGAVDAAGPTLLAMLESRREVHERHSE
jgi:hypothetical protein